jgi:hypothetical protein
VNPLCFSNVKITIRMETKPRRKSSIKCVYAKKTILYPVSSYASAYSASLRDINF